MLFGGRRCVSLRIRAIDVAGTSSTRIGFARNVQKLDASSAHSTRSQTDVRRKEEHSTHPNVRCCIAALTVIFQYYKRH